MKETTKSGFSPRTMTFCAVSAAVMCILGPMSIAIGAVPISFTNLVIYLSVFVIGRKRTTISYIIYLMLGMFGLPVFSGYSGGFAKLAGPTGGYLIGFIFMAVICGYFWEKSHNKYITAVGMVIATAVAYIFGTAWFVVLMKCTWAYALGICVFPFIVFDIIKIIIACVAGPVIRNRIAPFDTL